MKITMTLIQGNKKIFANDVDYQDALMRLPIFDFRYPYGFVVIVPNPTLMGILHTQSRLIMSFF